jgi:hypothetical protein
MKITQTDCEDVNRNGKFIPYLMNTISNKGEIYLTHHINQYKNVNYIMFVFGEPEHKKYIKPNGFIYFLCNVIRKI